MMLDTVLVAVPGAQLYHQSSKKRKDKRQKT